MGYRKWLAIFVAVVMLLALFPAVSVAEENNGECGEKVVDLIAGQNMVVGTVTVTNDDENVCVTYELNSQAVKDGWRIYETHIYVGDCSFEGVLTKPNRQLGEPFQANPIPGAFPYGKDDLNGVTSYTECISFEELEFGICDEVCVAAHAVVKRSTRNAANATIYGNIGGYEEGQGDIYTIDPLNRSENQIFECPANVSFAADWYPNALAYDEVNKRLYFTTAQSKLMFYDLNSAVLTDASGSFFNNTDNVLGATFGDGAYWYILNRSEKLYRVDFDNNGIATGRTEYVMTTESKKLTQGDIVFLEDGIIFGSSGTGASPSGGFRGFFTYDIVKNEFVEVYNGDSSFLAPQLAWGLDANGEKVMYGTNQQNVWTINTVTGAMTPVTVSDDSDEPFITDNRYQDLASAISYTEKHEEQTAWGKGFRFNEKGNWGMWFKYKICEPCPEPVLVNGGFETPVVTTSQGWNIYASGTENLGWTVEWMGSYIGAPAIANLELHKAGVGEIPATWTAFAGSQYAELDTDWDGPGGGLNNEQASVKIYQDISTCGQTFTLKYAWSPRPGHADNKLEVWWKGDKIAEHEASGAGNNSTVWTFETKTNLSSNPNSLTRLEFRETGTPDSFGMFLDAVSIEVQE